MGGIIMIDIPEEKKKHFGFMGKSFTLLFYTQILITVLSVFKSQYFAENFPLFCMIIRVVALITIVFYYVYLSLIKDQSIRYGNACLFGLIAIVCDFIFAFLPLKNTFVILLASAVTLILTGLGEYNEYIGHAEYFAGVSDNLQNKWTNLCTVYLITLITTVICSFLIILMPRFAAFCTVISLLVLVVVRILKMVYLHDSGAYLKNYGKPIQ
jgi:hypothetical protein